MDRGQIISHALNLIKPGDEWIVALSEIETAFTNSGEVGNSLEALDRLLSGTNRKGDGARKTTTAELLAAKALVETTPEYSSS